MKTQDTTGMVAGYQPYKDYDPELERAVLGVCLVEPRSFSKVYGILNSDCFYVTSNQQVFAAMEAVWKDGLPIDILTVSRRLYDDDMVMMENRNTGIYLSQLCYDVVSSAHLQTWCLLLRELAARRMMISITSTRFRDDDVLKGAEDIQASLQQALQVRHAGDWTDASAAAISLTQHMDDVMNNDCVGVQTGFPTLDRENGGFRPGQLVVIGARPSVGKSALMGSIAMDAARNGNKVGILSLEMPAKDIFGRMVSRQTDIPFAQMDRHGIADEQDRNTIVQALPGVAALPIWFCDTSRCTIHDIRAKAEQLKQRNGLDMLLVDYLQLIEETDNYRNREQNISQISRGLKMLAMNLEIPVVALSQLNRESEHRSNKKPTMADLRESGAIEQDADIIMLLHRDWRSGILNDEFGNSTEFQADLLIPKWRNGSPLSLKLRFEGATMKFSEAA